MFLETIDWMEHEIQGSANLCNNHLDMNNSSQGDIILLKYGYIWSIAKCRIVRLPNAKLGGYSHTVAYLHLYLSVHNHSYGVRMNTFGFCTVYIWPLQHLAKSWHPLLEIGQICSPTKKIYLWREYYVSFYIFEVYQLWPKMNVPLYLAKSGQRLLGFCQI